MKSVCKTKQLVLVRVLHESFTPGLCYSFHFQKAYHSRLLALSDALMNSQFFRVHEVCFNIVFNSRSEECG